LKSKAVIPAKICQEFHHFNQKSKETTKNRVCIKKWKVPNSKHKKVGFFKIKIKSMIIQYIFTIQMSFAHKRLSKTQRKIVEEQILCLRPALCVGMLRGAFGGSRGTPGGRGA